MERTVKRIVLILLGVVSIMIASCNNHKSKESQANLETQEFLSQKSAEKNTALEELQKQDPKPTNYNK